MRRADNTAWGNSLASGTTTLQCAQEPPATHLFTSPFHLCRYSRLIAGLGGARIELNRKVLADLAVTEPLSFKAVIQTVKQPV